MHSKLLVSAAAGALLALTGAAFAQSAVVATTDLNVRAGPGPQHQVIGVLGAGQSANLDGCLQSNNPANGASSPSTAAKAGSIPTI